jgi:glycosidase
MRKVKPDAVLLSEIFGPVWHSVCNLVHDNMTQGSIAFLEMMDRGEVTAESYKRHLARFIDALPEGALRVRFGRNHDTSWFYHFTGYTPRFLAFDAIHAFFGIPEVFAGDRKNPPHPDDDPQVYEYYRKIFAARRQYPELVHGEIRLRDVEGDNAAVFSGVRRAGTGGAVVLVSLSDKEETVSATLTAASVPAKFTFADPISGSSVAADKGGGRSFKVKMRPFQVLIGRL